MSYVLVPDAKAILLPPDRGLVTPESNWVDVEGERYVVCPHDIETTRALRAMGVMVPAPIGYYYEWPKIDGLYDPMSHQRDTAAFASLHRRCYILNDLGTGKTHSALWAMDYLMDIGEIERAIIVTPLSTMERVWGDGIRFTLRHRKFEVLHGTPKRRWKLLDRDVPFYIVNHDGLEIIADALRERRDINHITIDELTAYRNSGTRRWRKMNSVIMPGHSVWGLTGAPRPTEPTDVHAQCRLITPHTVTDSFRMLRFKTMEQHSTHVWTEKPEANKVISTYMVPAIRFTRAQCVDLPEFTVSSRQVPMTKEQAAAYKSMSKDLKLQLAKGEITAANAGVKALKLLQIACGAVYDDERNVHYINAAPRLNELIELREQIAEGKIIVFAPFRPVVEMVYRFLVDKYGEPGVAMVHGNVSKGARDGIFARFQTQGAPGWLVADAGTMAHGLTLTQASTIIWYGPARNNEIYVQANARITRVGQLFKAHAVHLSSSASENRLFKLCGVRSANQDDYLKIIEEAVELV